MKWVYKVDYKPQFSLQTGLEQLWLKWNKKKNCVMIYANFAVIDLKAIISDA